MSIPSNTLSHRDILKEKFLAEHPDARVASGLPRIDLQAYSTKLLAQQRHIRLSAAAARKEARHERNRFRARVRLEKITPATKPLDTGTDRARGNLYFELPNGQILNAARILGTRLTKSGDWMEGAFSKHKAAHRRFFRTQVNPVLFAIVQDAVEANAAREEKPVVPATEAAA